MLLYRLLKYPTRFALCFFYKRIYMLGLEHLPKHKPTIAAANHPNTFADPITLASLQLNDLYFWARANEFKHPFLSWVARNVHMLPIHRLRDGKDGMQKNTDTFDATKKILAQNNMLFVAPEGDCEIEKRLRILKQGAARIALEFAAQNPTQTLYILPTGLNYTTITRGWGDFFMVFGAPIEAQRYLADYAHDPQAAVEQLTADLRKAMTDVMLYIDKPENDAMVEGLWEIYRNDNPAPNRPTFQYSPQRFEEEQRVAQKSQLATDLDALRTFVELYFETLKKLNINDFALATATQNHSARATFVLLLLPLKIAALLTLPPILLAKFIVDKYVKDHSFRAPIVVVLGMFGYSFWLISLAFISAIWLAWYFALLLPPILLALQYFSQHWDEQFLNIANIVRCRAFAEKQPEEAMQLLAQRQQLQNDISGWLKP
jgi:1-acyl-sn-glycerol-3-phosphate acyltransferase